MTALRNFAVGLLMVLFATDAALATEGAFGSTSLNLEARCKGQAEKLTKVPVRVDHRVAEVANGAAEITALFAARECVLGPASSRAVGMIAEMTVLDFHGSVYAAAVAFNHFIRTSDTRQPAPVIDAMPCKRILAATEDSKMHAIVVQNYSTFQSSLESLKSTWKFLSKAERELLNGYIFKVSAAYLRCAANQAERSSRSFYDDVNKIMDESAGFHAAYQVVLDRLTKK